MRHFLLILTLSLLAVASTGCKKARLRSQLKELMAATIVLPDSITCIYKGKVYPMPDFPYWEVPIVTIWYMQLLKIGARLHPIIVLVDDTAFN